MTPHRLLLFIGLLCVAPSLACNGDKVATPTSDKNYDDEGDNGSQNPVDPGMGGLSEAGARDAAHDAGADSASTSDSSSDAAPVEAAPEGSATSDAPSESGGDGPSE